MQIEVVSPVAEQRPEIGTPARRLDDLKGKKIALWWNTKDKGDIVLSAAAEQLGKRYKGMEFVQVIQRYNHGPEVYDRVLKAGFDAVIASTGD
ncbi:hypothetical protein ACFLW4_05550 [Chloroflexota bacterium]